MMKTNYKQGYNFENRIVKKLNNLGGLAYRTAGSHSPIDITYIEEFSIFLIQCKHSNKKDIDIKSLLCEDNVLKLAAMEVPFPVEKILLIKQPRSQDVIQLRYFHISEKWQLMNVFDLKS